MAEEFFDIVNERDEPIGRAPRREVHARKLWHRAVHVFVFDSFGRLFLQQRSLQKDMAAGLWDLSCSGHVDAGEDYDTAAVRELGEELGLQVTEPPRRWWRIPAQADTGWEFCWVYWVNSDGPFVLHPEEIAAGKWVEPDELTQLMVETPEEFTRPFHLIWNRLRGELPPRGIVD